MVSTKSAKLLFATMFALLHTTLCVAEERTNVSAARLVNDQQLREPTKIPETEEQRRRGDQLTVDFEDTVFDFYVYAATPVSGTEWVIMVVFPDAEDWVILGNPRYHDATESVSYTGVRSFKYEWSAEHEAELLHESGVIDDYFVYQREKQPSWSLVDICDSEEEAESLAQSIESSSNLVTWIDPVLAADMFLQTP